ncbi:MAG TPA: HEAT repeat domain-containing protein [Elusimicrobiales bacterium]|nr:HEAT repeat domain-containing protein [Elusimicrobiales bacterium]
MFLTHLTSSPHFYAILYAVICLLAAFNIFEVLFLFAHQYRLKRREAAKEELKHMISTAIITVTEPAAVLPKPGGAMEYEAYSETAASIIESFEGELAERAARLVQEFRISLHYQSLAKNSVWYKRAHAIDILSSLKLKDNRDFFNAAFSSEASNPVKYRILYGLSLLVRDRLDILDLAGKLAALPYLTAKFTEDVFFNCITVLKAAGKEEEFGLFLEQIRSEEGIPVKVKRDCLSACHAAACERAEPAVKEYYKAFQAEPEIIVACIKTLVTAGDFSILPEALRHKDWRVRLTALKHVHLFRSDISPDHNTLLHDPEYHFAALPEILRHKDWRTRLEDLKHAHLGNSEILRALQPLLHDHNYHIRLNAAQALAKMGPRGLEMLREEMTSPDKFAAETARYALNGGWTTQ